jgi:DeoR/GlpR family transcriptional regulator of sugar metabolism
MEPRKEQILSYAYQEGRVLVRDLAEQLGVSEATIRRDLHGLASEGLLELNHGGASVVRDSDYSFMSKSMRNIEAKKTIAQLAAGLVDDGDQIFLDSGTTCFAMTAPLRGKKRLSVIVNSIRIAQELKAPGVDTLLLGGQFRHDRMDTVGPIALETLEQLRGYRAFIGSDGISIEAGLSSVDIESAHIIKQVSRNARENILLADSSKFGHPALYKIMDFENVSMVITETKPSDEWMDFFASQNVRVLYPNQ